MINMKLLVVVTPTYIYQDEINSKEDKNNIKEGKYFGIDIVLI